MKIELDAQSMITNEKRRVEVDKYPDACPICHQGVLPIPLNRSVLGSQNAVEVLFQCPRAICAHTFIARYRRVYNSSLSMLAEVVPVTVQDTEFPEAICKVSKDFVDIALEATKAEQLGLMLVCGPAYRKALEFLIKDYVILLHLSEADAIKNMPLGACISTYVRNDRVLEVAKRAAWLGNDEAHYLRKWIDKDLKDLKNLITLAMRWIEMEELTKRAISEMPEPQKF